MAVKCASVKSCLVFMPRIDLWAAETHFQDAENSDYCSANNQIPEIEESCFTQSQVSEKENEFNPKKDKSAEMVKGQASTRASHAWMSFIEQVESIGVSTSLMILATSEVPYPELPCKVREFFRSYQSSDGQSASLVQTVPRFSLQIDGNFDHDAVINLSAVELFRNVIEQLVQLIYQRSHVDIGFKKGYRTYNAIESCKDRACQGKDNGSTNENKDRIQPPEPLSKVPPPPNSRLLKGKSTLLLAISTFGYQILRFPHFAELCWVTSKLKEGPSTDVSGPWKGWPFNSCIIRPNNPQDKVAISCSSGNIKSKEKSGLVRGLMAVGLSAYRGAYTSVREVSSEVRKVLEILVREINTKVQAGKDRYQYLRVLSQVAYLEDMVNNWAYALLSLEQDSPELVAKVTSTSVGSLNSNLTCKELHQLVVPMEGHETEMLERIPKGIAAETPGCHALNNRNDNLDNLDHDGSVTISERSRQKHSLLDEHINNSAAANQPVDRVANEENGTLYGLSESGTAGNHEMINEKFGSSKDSNGSALIHSVALSENEEFRLSKDLNGSTFTHSAALSDNELHSACEPEGIEIGNSRTESITVPGLSSAETGIKLCDVDSGIAVNSVEINVSSKGSDSTESGVVCLYQCCPGCLYSLYHLTQKILAREWGLNRSHWTVEDVHDVVASLSVDLISAVRKIYSPEDVNDLSNKTSRHEKHGTFLDCSNSRMCNPRNLDRFVVPAECMSHSTSQHATGSKDTASNELLKLDLKFVFRDGVLVNMDPDKDVSLHCKFETLCLCSVKELIVMTKHPFD